MSKNWYLNSPGKGHTARTRPRWKPEYAVHTNVERTPQLALPTKQPMGQKANHKADEQTAGQEH
eukprot:571386-Prorocentrum_lima.AAC.1